MSTLVVISYSFLSFFTFKLININLMCLKVLLSDEFVGNKILTLAVADASASDTIDACNC